MSNGAVFLGPDRISITDQRKQFEETEFGQWMRTTF